MDQYMFQQDMAWQFPKWPGDLFHAKRNEAWDGAVVLEDRTSIRQRKRLFGFADVDDRAVLLAEQEQRVERFRGVLRQIGVPFTESEDSFTNDTWGNSVGTLENGVKFVRTERFTRTLRYAVTPETLLAYIGAVCADSQRAALEEMRKDPDYRVMAASAAGKAVAEKLAADPKAASDLLKVLNDPYKCYTRNSVTVSSSKDRIGAGRALIAYRQEGFQETNSQQARGLAMLLTERLIPMLEGLEEVYAVGLFAPVTYDSGYHRQKITCFSGQVLEVLAHPGELTGW